MKRLARDLRASILPLLAIVSVATLAGGVAAWQGFYRDLYVEEERALKALAQEVGTVRYRREGEVEPLAHVRTSSDYVAHDFDVPSSVAFLGRVEYVEAEPIGSTRLVRFRPNPTDLAALERVRALPGLRGFRCAAWETHDAFVDYDPREELRRRVPDPPDAELAYGALNDAMPTGTELDADEADLLARQIATAWKEERTNRPYVVLVQYPPGVQNSLLRRLSVGFNPSTGAAAEPPYGLELVDGDRRLSLSTMRGLGPRNTEPHVTLLTETDLWEWQLEEDQSRLLSCVGRDLLKTDDFPSPFDPFAVGLPADLRPPSASAERLPDVDSLLGEEGERIVRVGRLDDDRLVFEAESAASSAEGKTDDVVVRAVVREDLDFAVERFEIDSNGWRMREVRRLSVVDGQTVVAERARDAVASSGRGAYGGGWTIPPERLLVSVAFDPVYDARAFDPRTYGGPVAQPRELSSVRTYHLLWIAGLVGLCVAGIGSLARMVTSRRSTSSDPGSRAGSRLRLRFGFATLFAITLLVIGTSGWIKCGIDETQEDLAFVEQAIERDGVFLRVARHEPPFPWSLISTSAFPIGAPLSTIHVGNDPPSEVQERLLSLSPAIDYYATEPFHDRYRIQPETLAVWIGRPLPEFEPDDEQGGRALDPIPRGEPVSQKEADALLAQARQAWLAARAARPTRFVHRRRSTFRDAPGALAIRDGDRSWRVDSLPTGRRILVHDGAFLRTYVQDVDGWMLTQRIESEKAGASLTAPFGTQFGISVVQGREREDAMLELPLAPFAMSPDVAILRDRLDDALVQDDRDLELSVKRIDDHRLRIEAARTMEVVGSDLQKTTLRSTCWTMLVLTDLDWCVERCDAVETYQSWETRWPSDPFERLDPAKGQPVAVLIERRREIRCLNTLKRIGGQVFAVDSRLQGCDWASDEEPQWQYERRSDAIELDSPIDERLFDRPTLDSPDPVVPREKKSFAWYIVPLLLGAAILAVDPIRAAMVRLRRTWSKNAARSDDDLGKESA